MNELISRQDAIKAISQHLPYVSEKRAEIILSQLPSAQPEQRWIPCSEPPEESGTYIVTAHDGVRRRVTFVKYQKMFKQWDLTGQRAYWRILAYMPLPEPWKGEEHEL